MTANEYGFFLGGWGDKNVLESDSGDGHTTLQIYKKNHCTALFKTMNFVPCELYVNKKQNKNNNERQLCK